MSPQTIRGLLTIHGTFKPAGDFSLLTSLRFKRHHILLTIRGGAKDRDDWLKDTEFTLQLDATHQESLESLCDTLEDLLIRIDRLSRRNVFTEQRQTVAPAIIQSYRDLLREIGGPGAALLESAKRLPTPDDDFGVRSLFETSRLFDAYSLLSLCGSFTTSPEETATLLASQGYDLEELLRYAEQVGATSGVKLIEETGGVIRIAF